MPRQFSLPSAAFRQYLPLPYMPSNAAAVWVISATSFGSVGDPFSRNSMNFRASSGGSVSLSKFLDSATSLFCSRAPRSPALAAMASVSSVM